MRAQRHTPRTDRGFSFIELLAYMAIAALLILAAIPQFNNYRGQARDQATMNDARNVAVAMEAWGISNPGTVYPFINIGWAPYVDGGADILAANGVTLSNGTRIAVRERSTWSGSLPTVLSGKGEAFCVFASNDNGRKHPSANVFQYHSGNGGMGVPCASK